MTYRHHLPLPALLATLTLLLMPASLQAGPRSLLRQAAALQNSDKAVEVGEKLWNPTAGFPGVTADVPEAEPNDVLQEANPFGCDDNLRPAAIGVPDDIDILVIQASAGDQLTVGTNADGAAGQVGDTIMGIFDSAGNVLVSDDDSGPALYSLISDFPAPYTGTYYLAVIAWDPAATGAYQAFLRCAQAPPPPVNDTCAGALALPCKSVNLTGTTRGAANDYTPITSGSGGCTGFAANGADVVYVLTLAPTGSVALDYTSADDGSIYLLDACVSPAGAACVAGADATFTGDTEHLDYTNTSGANQTLYLVLDSFGTGSFGDFTLTGTVSCPPVAVAPLSWGALKARFAR